MNRLTVALSGLAEEDVGCVRGVLDRPQFKHWQFADGPDGDVVLIDIDSVWGHMDWLKATANGQRTIACSAESELRDHDLKLMKPLDTEALAQLLSDIEASISGSVPAPREAAAPAKPKPAERMETASEPEPAQTKAPEPAQVPKPVAHAQTAGKPEPSRTSAAATAAPLSTPAPAPAPTPAASAAVTEGTSASTDMGSATIGDALISRSVGTAFSIRGDDGTTLSIDPRADVYVGPAQLKPLLDILALPMDRAEMLDSGKTPLNGPTQPLARLVWFAALSATPGELAPSLDRLTAFRLNRWPQIEREFPRHFRIATAMMKQSGTLGEIASLANTPEADVADFINAYHAVGYVDSGEVEPETGADSGVLSRLRKPFARGA